jgi:hypothetical protein
VITTIALTVGWLAVVALGYLAAIDYRPLGE